MKKESKKLVIKKETAKSLKVRSTVQTGAPPYRTHGCSNIGTDL